MRKSIYLLKTTPSSHTHTFHPLSTIVIHTLNFTQVQSMDDNCGEWVECMGVASGCGEQEVGVASGSGWNLWVWLLGVVLRRYIDFLILLIPTPLVSALFCSSSLLFFLKKKCFSFLYIYIYREDFAQQYRKCGARSGSSQLCVCSLTYLHNIWISKMNIVNSKFPCSLFFKRWVSCSLKGAKR